MVAARTWHHLLAGLAIAGVVLPPQQLAAAEVIGGAHGAAVAAVARAPIGDVELGRGGLLVGRLVDTTGRPVAGRDVSVVVGDKTIAVSRTDGSGVFAVAGLRGGVHQITTVESARVCRLWAPGTAPPQTPPSLELVAGEDVVRGQWGPPPGNRFLKEAKIWATNPFVVGGIIAAAVAIPIALSDDDGPHS